MAINSNTQIYDKTLDRAAMIRLYERRVSGKVDLVIDGHVVRLDKLIKDAELSGRGFERFREAVDQELRKTYKSINNSVQKDLTSLVSDQLSYAYQKVEVAMGKIWRTERPKNRISEEIVLKNPLSENGTMEQGWSGIAKNEKIRLEAVIRKGIADGKSVDEIALQVRAGNVHNITRMQSKGLVITAITAVSSQADHAIYKANEKALQGWQYVAVLDARTTPLCAHRDGEIYPISDTTHLPPAHWHCRSTTVPVFKSWSDIADLESAAQVRRRNIENLTDAQKAFYDGNTPLRESYNDWLKRQPQDVQLRHLGDYKKVSMFQSGQLTLDQFTNPEGNSIGIKELRRMTDPTYTLPNDTKKFANAKAKLDAMQLPIMTPDDLIGNTKLIQTLKDYYLLQSGELDGTLSLTNYRGGLIHTKKSAKARVLNSLPTEDQLIFNPVTGRYEDTRLYQPNPSVLNNNLRLTEQSNVLKPKDKEFIKEFNELLSEKMGANERAVVVDNLRILFTRFRNNGEQWNNFKAVVQGQIKFDVMNVSDAIETQIRSDTNVLKKLKQDNYLDPVLGPTQLQDLHDNFLSNIREKNNWEDTVAPKIARELRNTFDYKIPLVIKRMPNGKERISESALQQFYLKFAHRLSLADMPDRDQFAIALGRDLYNLANMNGTRRKWYETGMKLLEAKNVNKFFEVETYGVQKRRMKSRLSGALFGPYYDTLSYNIRVTDPRVQKYSQLTRKVDVGLRVGVTTDKNKLVFREGYKTYFIDNGVFGLEDTRIPITSTHSFADFPVEFVDKNMADALNWASKSKYKIDNDFYDFTQKLLYFEDDRGAAKKYNDLNEYKHYISSRGDAYERFKSMDWLRNNDYAFSNHAFVDHRARIYDRGLISPQSGESFRPFLNTEVEKVLGEDGYRNFRDQIGAFMGGLNDVFEGRYNSLSFTGRQKIADKLWPDMVDLGNKMLRARPADLRAILESDMVQLIEGEELGKFMRFAMEAAKIDNHLKAGGSMNAYKTALALEQDASSSGAQIIALTTKNKQLASLSNVIPTNQKRRLYDEIAAATFNDPRFKVLNERLGLNEKDLRKAAKAQNMVTFYGAGERTGILNVEGKLAKVLEKKPAKPVETKVTEGLLSERQDSAGLLRVLGVDNKTDPNYVGTVDEIIKSQGELISKAMKGQLSPAELKDTFKWLHTSDIELTEARKERATYKTFDPKTGEKFSEEKIAENKAKFEQRSKGNTKKYIAMQVVEELGEFLEEHLLSLSVPKDARAFKLIEAQKRILKSNRFGEDTVIKDEASVYNLKTNKQAAEMALEDAELTPTSTDPEAIIKDLNSALQEELANVTKKPETYAPTLVVKASDRDKVLNEISARAARYERFDPETTAQLKELRENVKDIFNKGLDPGDEIMEQLYFLDPATKDLVEKMTHSYDMVVTPRDFQAIAKLMSEHLSEQVPILKDFTKFFGRLAEDYLTKAKPSQAAMQWKSIGATGFLGTRKNGYVLPDRISEILGLKAGEALSEKFLKRFDGWKPDGVLADLIYGVKGPKDRRTGFKIFKLEPIEKLNISKGFEVFYANKLPKSWTNVPWVNFDGKIIEQNFTQSFEERLVYKDKDGNWVNNLVQVQQKTEATWWEQVVNAEGKINDIADATKARTAYAVNGNHSNDATLVKNFHLWGRDNTIATSTIHDAFFANAADMLEARKGIRKLYANVLDKNPVKVTLDEMLARGFPKELYDQYLEEAIDKGLIPVAGKSVVGGKTLTEADILTKKDVMSDIPDPAKFEDDWGFYGIG
jgi:SPP1 gp7 family putative phage head morphogenesis protein